MNKLLRWSRNPDKSMFLEVLVDGKWKHYKNSPFNTADATISSNNGFATAQKCLSLGYKYLPMQFYIARITDNGIEKNVKIWASDLEDASNKLSSGINLGQEVISQPNLPRGDENINHLEEIY
jgi:hypothetical protein